MDGRYISIYTHTNGHLYREYLGTFVFQTLPLTSCILLQASRDVIFVIQTKSEIKITNLIPDCPKSRLPRCCVVITSGSRTSSSIYIYIYIYIWQSVSAAKPKYDLSFVPWSYRFSQKIIYCFHIRVKALILNWSPGVHIVSAGRDRQCPRSVRCPYWAGGVSYLLLSI